MSAICAFIWDFCEDFNIPLGKLAPYVFGGIVGKWPKRIK